VGGSDVKYGEADTIDDIVGTVEGDGVVRRRELWRHVLSHSGGWCSLAIGVQDRKPFREEWGPERVWITKWRRVAHRWVRQSAILVPLATLCEALDGKKPLAPDDASGFVSNDDLKEEGET